MYEVKLLLEAELELTDVCAWYENRKQSLGKKLIDEFDFCVSLIAHNPYHLSINFSEKYRVAMLKKFP